MQAAHPLANPCWKLFPVPHTPIPPSVGLKLQASFLLDGHLILILPTKLDGLKPVGAGMEVKWVQKMREISTKKIMIRIK